MFWRVTAVAGGAWAIVSTFLLIMRPDVGQALNNWMYSRKSMQGHTFLANGPEAFEAYGSEAYVFCKIPCVIYEEAESSASGYVCNSNDDGRGRNICSGSFRPGRRYWVWPKKRADFK